MLRAYAWIMSLGAEGLNEVAEIAVLNNNYLEKLLLAIPGVSESYGEGKVRLDQIRYSWEKLTEDTGVTEREETRRPTPTIATMKQARTVTRATTMPRKGTPNQ